MNAFLRNCLRTGILVVAAARAPAQSSTEQNGLMHGPVAVSEVAIKYFTPIAYEAPELANAAAELFGAEVQLRRAAKDENGATTEEIFGLPHFIVLRNSILIRDVPAVAEQIAKVLAELDQGERERMDRAAQLQRAEEAKQAELARREQEDAEAHQRLEEQRAMAERGEIADTMLQIHPRYVPISTIESALQPFQRQVAFTQDGKNPWLTTSITQIAETQMLVICETRERAAQLKELVEQVDRPQPQAVISVMLIQAADSGHPSNLPGDLTDNLHALVPAESFQPLSTGVLRASLANGRTCDLQMDLGVRGNWSLHFTPEAFNPETGEITLAECQFSLQLAPERANEPQTNQSFTTNLIFKAGEYVVLGAVGVKPVFIVVRAEILKKSA